MEKYKNYLSDFLLNEKNLSLGWFDNFRRNISRSENPFLFQKSFWTEREIKEVQEKIIAEFINRIEAIEKDEKADPKLKDAFVLRELLAKSRFAGKMESVRKFKQANLLYYKHEFDLFKLGVYKYL